MKKFFVLSCAALLGLTACDPSFIMGVPSDPGATMGVWVNADVQNGKMGDNAVLIAGHWTNALEDDFFTKYFRDEVFMSMEGQTEYWNEKSFINTNAYAWATPYEYVQEYGKEVVPADTLRWITEVNVQTADENPADGVIEVKVTTKQSKAAKKAIVENTLVAARFFVSTAFVKSWEVEGFAATEFSPEGDGLVYHYPASKEVKDFTGYVVVEPNHITLLGHEYPKFTVHKGFGDYVTVYAPLNADGEVMFENIPTPDGVKSWPSTIHFAGKSVLDGASKSVDLKVLDINPNIEVGVVQYLQEPNKARGLVHKTTYNKQILEAVDAAVAACTFKVSSVKLTVNGVGIAYIPYQYPGVVEGVERPADYSLNITL